MALEAAIYSQDPFGYPPLFEDQYYGYNGFHQQQEDDQGAINRSPPLLILDDKIMFNDSITTTSPPAPMQQPIHGITSSCCWEDCFYYNINNDHHHYFSSPELCTTACGGAFFNPPPQEEDVVATSTFVAPARRKRRRTKSTKNKEEVESQRITHIAVERNRRKQMNDYLALLRSLMPSSYELEQLLQAMEAQKAGNHQKHAEHDDDVQAESANNGLLSSSPLFSEFFAFPQYSTQNQTLQAQPPEVSVEPGDGMADGLGGVPRETAVGEIEVTMVECHANVKILVRKQHRQLVKLVTGLQGLGFTILHLNVTATSTSDQMLYSLSFKVEEGCRLITADEIAAAVNQMLRRIEEGSCYQEC
ncbi:unnamed protein product [Linum tenue]|uniref:BHLH domain-containing protein n=1 Tax=Linum tenue TaxID=586396 RepID=A0AAV0HNM0_9ROSI|nr:unnamed protein product [Linum tenue]